LISSSPPPVLLIDFASRHRFAAFQPTSAIVSAFAHFASYAQIRSIAIGRHFSEKPSYARRGYFGSLPLGQLQL